MARGEPAPGDARPALVLTAGSPSYTSYASAIVRARSRLRGMFGIDIVGGPPFDMLLLIFAAGEGGVPIAGGEIAASLRISPALMARWRLLLERNDILVSDREKLVLTPRAHAMLEGWLAEVSSIPLTRE